MRRTAGPDTRFLLGAAAAVVVLAAGSTVAIAAAEGGFGRHTETGAVRCAAPAALPGTVVDVTLIDMAGMGGMMRDGQSGWRTWRPGMMRIAVAARSVQHGTVSLRVTNRGVITHELVVLPLTGGQAVGTRTVGQDGTVKETGSLGEVSATCAAGSGNRLAPASTGWATLALPAGRYELVCNLPGHYAAGMYAQLDVS
jgi:uncharacterized cupredoxin-like copper-binding protein